MTLIISNGFKNIDATIQSSDAHLGDYSLKIKQNHQIIRDIIIIAAVFNSDSQWVRISTTYFSIAKIAAYRAHLLNFKTVNQVYFTLSCQGMTWNLKVSPNNWLYKLPDGSTMALVLSKLWEWLAQASWSKIVKWICGALEIWTQGRQPSSQ